LPALSSSIAQATANYEISSLNPQMSARLLHRGDQSLWPPALKSRSNLMQIAQREFRTSRGIGRDSLMIKTPKFHGRFIAVIPIRLFGDAVDNAPGASAPNTSAAGPFRISSRSVL
jgi:hypothetical protein